MSVTILSSHLRAEDRSVLIELQKKALQKKISNERMWHLLLHYKKGLFGNEKSDIDGPDFFLSKKGHTNPQAELDATLTSFFDPLPKNPYDQHSQCRYPARYAWLNEQLGLDGKVPVITCDRFNSWHEKIDPDSITLIFAGYYLNNPASMYGHTFLRVGRRSGGDEKPLINYTINFAAKTNTKNGLMFALLGLAGGYPGTFTALPYYMKVQQYNNLESRDLWEYKLNFSSANVERLIQHLWEMGPTSISYYFLNKNCSYQLLPMLEVADPNLHLTERFRFRAIPVDTLRVVLEQPGIVKEFRDRPSALRKMLASRSVLSTNERKLAVQFNSEKVNKLPLERQRLVLESAYDYLHYRYGFYRNQPIQMQEREREILMALNALPATSEGAQPKIPDVSPPHQSHKTGRLGLGFGVTRNKSFEEVSLRGALHDLEMDPKGFVQGSQLEMLSFRARLENDNSSLYLEEGTIIHVRSLSLWDEWIRKPSWNFRIHYARAHDLNQEAIGSGYAGVQGGSGFSFGVSAIPEGILYGTIDLDSGVGGIFRDHYRVGIGPTFGFVCRVLPIWRAHLKASYMRYGMGNISSANRLQLIQSWQLPKDFETRLILSRENFYQEGTIVINRYF